MNIEDDEEIDVSGDYENVWLIDGCYIVYKTWWSALLSTLHSCSNDTQYTPRFEIEFCVYLSVNNIWFSFCKSQTKGEMVWYTVYEQFKNFGLMKKKNVHLLHSLDFQMVASSSP
jgi:hypothetical protein